METNIEKLLTRLEIREHLTERLKHFERFFIKHKYLYLLHKRKI